LRVRYVNIYGIAGNLQKSMYLQYANILS